VRVAIVHDWLNQYGGAERVLEVLKSMFPDAPIFTSIYWPAAMPDLYGRWDIRTSFLDRWPLVKRHHLWFLPFYPLVFEQFDLVGFDLVISNKSAFCHGVITPPATTHLCYCLTPTRFLWNTREYLEAEGGTALVRPVLPFLLNYLRLWDRAAADRVDHFAGISRAVRERIEKYYRRDARVIHPPVDTHQFVEDAQPENYFLVISRLIPYKRIDVAIQAFNQLGLPLVIIGDGRDRARLEKMARPNIHFKGWLADGEVREILARCQALIFPGLEDFGLAPIEAQAAGRPVIAFAGGGALDTVSEGVTGHLFSPQTPEALAEVVARFNSNHFDPYTIRQNAARFDVDRFKQKFSDFIGDVLRHA